MKQQLLISLEPFEDECLSSYITRLTIENLYDSVSWICKNIGTTKDHLFDVQPDSPIIKELNKLTGVPIYKLNKLTWI
uniref:TniQ family protein n=1 Tax=Bacillus TaxID=1386 RepID=UPI000553D666